MTELLNCPFCDRALVNPEGYASVVMVHPKPYQDCPAWGIVVHTDMPDRVAAWNRRPLNDTGTVKGETDLRTLVPGFRLDWSGLRSRFEDDMLRLEKLTTYEMRAAHLDEMARQFEDAVTTAISGPSATAPSPTPQPDSQGGGSIRICPRRDGPCPHGMGCTYWQVDMDCSTEALLDALIAISASRVRTAEPVAQKPAVYIGANDVVALVTDDMADTVRAAFETLPKPPLGEALLPLYLHPVPSYADAIRDAAKVAATQTVEATQLDLDASATGDRIVAAIEALTPRAPQ